MNSNHFEIIRQQHLYAISVEARHESFLLELGIRGPKLEASRSRLAIRRAAYNQLCLDNPDRGLDKTEV